MESKVSEILENILGMMGLEGSFEVVESEEEVRVTIETDDPGRLIGYHGETLDALQLIINQIISRQADTFKRVVVDIGGWRKSKEEDLKKRSLAWIEQVKESGKEMEVEPMPSWQRRIVHMTVSETDGVESESVGEGRERHLLIKPQVKPQGLKTRKSEKGSKGKIKDKDTV